jgi:uncharacterized membrane protein YfcA
MELLLFLAGLVSGFIDSIAGGGGLINLPLLSMYLGANPTAIGTNKVVGLLAAFVALVVYSWGRSLSFKKTALFCLAVGMGAFAGSRAGVNLPKEAFWWLLFFICPIILWVTLKKDLWIRKELEQSSQERHPHVHSSRALFAGLAIGFYDGIWGPGGGTFMLLGLLFFVDSTPVIVALASSKLANTLSAGVSLYNYAAHDHVNWMVALPMAVGVTIGAILGARFASQKSLKVIRPTLVVVVILLLVRLYFTAA